MMQILTACTSTSPCRSELVDQLVDLRRPSELGSIGPIVQHPEHPKTLEEISRRFSDAPHRAEERSQATYRAWPGPLPSKPLRKSGGCRNRSEEERLPDVDGCCQDAASCRQAAQRATPHCRCGLLRMRVHRPRHLRDTAVPGAPPANVARQKIVELLRVLDAPDAGRREGPGELADQAYRNRAPTAERSMETPI